MIEIGLAISGAQAAYKFMKAGVQVGKDLQDMGQQLQQWAGCMAEIDQAEKMAEKPPWYKSLGGGTQAQAMEVFLARKQAQKNARRLAGTHIPPSDPRAKPLARIFANRSRD